MAKTYKILGQVAAGAGTDNDLYVVPALAQAVASTLVICNKNVNNAISSYRVAVVKHGGVLGPESYLRYEKLIEARDDHNMVIGLSLEAGDKVIVHASSADLSFSLFGAEIA